MIMSKMKDFVKDYRELCDVTNARSAANKSGVRAFRDRHLVFDLALTAAGSIFFWSCIEAFRHQVRLANDECKKRKEEEKKMQDLANQVIGDDEFAE
jgi:hypothetical protein